MVARAPVFLAAVMACVTVLNDGAEAFTPARHQRSRTATVSMAAKGYDPKWKKLETLADKTGGVGDLGNDGVGLVGTIQVTFKEGNATKSTMAIAGQPLSDVATQAGQFIKYGCGKGECGTCESLADGKWIRPCSTNVPFLDPGSEYVIQVKETKARAKAATKFFSVTSFFSGFKNNLIGMVGFVTTRRLVKKNFDERMEYEDMLAKKVAEKKAAKAAKEGKKMD